MSLHRLIFDTTAPAESANVGAYLRAGTDGDLLSSTNVGGKEGLDVNVINASLTVTATDFDIRDLDAAQDNIAISDGVDTLAVNADGSINITDNGGSLTVDAVDLDIRDLDAAQDSVQSNLFDGAGTALTSTLVGADQALDVNVVNGITVNDVDNIAMTTEADSITTTSGAAITSVLANRKDVKLYNNGSKIIYIGPSGVSTADGFPLPPGSILEAEIGPAVAIHAVAQTGTQELRVMQLS